MSSEDDLHGRVAVVEYRIQHIEKELEERLSGMLNLLNDIKTMVNRDEGAKGAWKYMVYLLLGAPAAVAVIVSAMWHLVEKR